MTLTLTELRMLLEALDMAAGRRRLNGFVDPLPFPGRNAFA